MYCIASHRVLSPLTEEERQQLLTQAHLHTLVEMLEAIPDPRGKHGLRYDLPYLLSPKILVEYTVSSISITQPSIRQLSAFLTCPMVQRLLTGDYLMLKKGEPTT